MAGDALITETMDGGWIILLALMTAGAFGFAWAIGTLSSRPALLIATGTLATFALLDLKLLFANNRNWNTGFLYLEFISIAVLILINKYVLEESKRKFLKQAFSRFVSPQVVRRIINDPSKLALSGEKRDLSVLFSDIRDFMPFSAKLQATSLHAFLNEFHGLVTKVVVEKGTLDKYIGDNVMAFWGAPLDQPNHAYNACQAALKIVRELSAKNPYFRAKYGQEIRIGIGIHTGGVIVGNMGSEQVFSYTAIGEEVNLASRVERLTRYYGVDILVTRATLEAVRTSGEAVPPHRMIDRVIVKGSQHAVDIAQLLDRDYPAEALRAFEEGRRHYTDRHWSEAIALFRSAQDAVLRSLQTNDVPSQILIERCEAFKENPPPEKWDGSYEMARK